jgi:hypothetical protein
MPHGDPLPPEADVYRGLRRESFSPDGYPTEANFIMKKKDRIENGPSHLICDRIPRPDAERFFPLVVRLNVGEMLNPPEQQSLSERGVVVVPYRDARSDEFFQEYAHAHAVLTGYQGMTNREIQDFKRYLALLAKRALQG